VVMCTKNATFTIDRVETSNTCLLVDVWCSTDVVDRDESKAGDSIVASPGRRGATPTTQQLIVTNSVSCQHTVRPAVALLFRGRSPGSLIN